MGQPVTGHASKDTQTKLCVGGLSKDATFVSKATFVVQTIATLAATFGSENVKCKKKNFESLLKDN